MPTPFDPEHLRVAIIHEWLVTYAGSEKVTAELLALFPRAEVFTTVDFLPADQRAFLRGRPVHTTFIQRLPFAKRKYRGYLPLMPLAIEQFDLSGFDLVLSSSHAVAKGVLTGPDQPHICYCHTPARYAWDLQARYLAEAGLGWGLRGLLARWLLHRFRQWDTRAALGVDHFIANSRYIGRRIAKSYRRESTVIHPPVDVERFTPDDQPREDVFLAASRVVPYKRLDLLVEAFKLMPDRRLQVIGDGPGLAKLHQLAGPNVEILGWQPDAVLRERMRRCRAFLFAAEEDFGIIPVEALACGTPVIAYGRGGSCETLVEGVTGTFFPEQTVASVRDAVERFCAQPAADPAACRHQAEKFSIPRFRTEILAHLRHVWETYPR